ncbi:MAG: sigma-70 family RNA polymerase sigma factor [Gemmataceae bacterium]|nr:sigma-70 family RNA polymerase sigma factor [Gemmataceae bacterium]
MAPSVNTKPGWCRKWNLQEADAQDVTQEVLLKLAAKLRDFRYDPSRSFRAWLKTLTHHTWKDFVENRQRCGQGTGDSQVQKWLATTEARDDLVQHLEAEFDRELLEEAIARVQLRVEARTWEAFRLLAQEGRSGAEVAQRLGMKVATVYVARSKVQRMLQEEVQKLEGNA